MNETTSTILNFIKQYIADNGYPPSVREIGTACHRSPGNVAYQLDLLQAHGFIERGEARQARAIKVLK